ncbi:MAG: rane protein [Glaciihabitans sp.]|jgi:hypothetical protein|nr:rane protein [Glaciihabitans sp.]MCU1534667.1 rane protein [Glaciihabitans sp.]MDQ1555827.1 hypothetical protein [Actinomycetota bacterium]
MPLSEQEQRLLEEMERSLYHNDADFVASVSSHRGRPSYAIVVTGVLLGIVGIATLLTGVIVRVPFVGVLGFVVMFVGVLLAVSPPRRPGAASTSRPGKSSFLHNFGDRADKRSDEPSE